MTDFVQTQPAEVCALLARAALDDSEVNGKPSAQSHTARDSSTLGTITLHEHQQDALRRIHAAIGEFGGALLADAVGLGKTYVALALARQYETTQVLAPAALMDMWQQAIAATASTNVSVHSLHRLSRTVLPPVMQGSLVIVDEAHHLRNHATARYRNVLPLLRHQHVLLLSATPLHNSARELRNLLALFLGNRPDALDDSILARCVIRRTHSRTHELPHIITHAPFRVPDNPAVLEHLLTLPPPLPLQLGSAAGALIRIGMLRAWCSSDAALTSTLRRRLTRGEALLHSLHHGRYPTQRELQSWISDDTTVQLGFPELLINDASSTTSSLLNTLLPHLDALQTLLQLHTRTATADAERIARLRALLPVGEISMRTDTTSQSTQQTSGSAGYHAQPPILAFSQFASTVHFLFRALSDLAGVAALTSGGGRIASGRITRNELIANFAPRANGRPPPGAHCAVRMLLATDVLSEGVNLQDAATVIHLDWPWTDALQQQRVGRLARLGSTHETINALAFAPPMGAESALHLFETLERKAQLHRALVGGRAEHGKGFVRSAGTSASAPDQASEVRVWWRNWLRNAVPPADSAAVRVAVVRGTPAGWLAAVAMGEAHEVVAHCAAPPVTEELTATANAKTARAVEALAFLAPPMLRARARTGVDIALVHQMVRAVHSLDCEAAPAGDEAGAASAEMLNRAVCELNEWFVTRQLQQLAGAPSESMAVVQQRALRVVNARFQALAPAHRASVSRSHSRVEHALRHVQGAAAEAGVQQWVDSLAHLERDAPTDSVALQRWFAAFPFAMSAPAKNAQPFEGSEENGWRLNALLLVVNA